jgi:hypothetical protein
MIPPEIPCFKRDFTADLPNARCGRHDRMTSPPTVSGDHQAGVGPKVVDISVWQAVPDAALANVICRTAECTFLRSRPVRTARVRYIQGLSETSPSAEGGVVAMVDECRSAGGGDAGDVVFVVVAEEECIHVRGRDADGGVDESSAVGARDQ